MKFNKKLARLESVYSVASSKTKEVTPLNISDFIHYIFDNPEQYKLEGINKNCFKNIYNKEPDKAIRIIYNILIEQGHVIKQRSIILEGIEFFKEDTEE